MGRHLSKDSSTSAGRDAVSTRSSGGKGKVRRFNQAEGSASVNAASAHAAITESEDNGSLRLSSGAASDAAANNTDLNDGVALRED